jgi:hypothetical protein
MGWLVFAAIFGWISILFWKRTEFGRHLTAMTNIFEQVETTRYTMHIGAGGGFDSLSKTQQIYAETVFDRGLAFLKTKPRHEITRNLLLNTRIAASLNRPIRLDAISNLLAFLVREGIAMDLHTFDQSFAD